MNRQANATAKSKKQKPNAQSDTVAAHLLLPKRKADGKMISFKH